jgi:hypothetical protein
MVSPLGSNIKSSWDSLLKGNSGIKFIKELPQCKDDPNFPDGVIAPIHESFDPKKWQVQVRSSKQS